MYNRYIGNTGKFYRVEDSGDKKSSSIPISEPNTPLHSPVKSSARKSGGVLPFGLSDGLKGLLKGILPEKIDIGDLLLILILLLLYIEKEDEDVLILLGALIIMGFDS